jgi:ParB family chromosome partitioning protein
MQIEIDKIIVKKRVRKTLDDIQPLMESMNKFGQFSPILITAKLQLIAGARRLEAAKMLGWDYINASIVDKRKKADLLEIEIEENLQRKDFSHEDLAEGYRRLEKLKRKNIFLRIWEFIKNIFKNIFFRDLKKR